MDTLSPAPVALDAYTVPTQFVESNGRKIAYRDIGAGLPLILCLRLRGVLDVWDPAFLNALAKDFRVITFDHSGLGQSTGHATYNRRSLAQDAIDLADALGIDKFVIGGWSLGGITAQIVMSMVPERVTHGVLIGTTPPGTMRVGPKPIFMQTALKPEYSFEDQVILFFHPESAQSRSAAKASIDRIEARTADKSPPIPEEVYMRMLGETNTPDIFQDDHDYRTFIKETTIPYLVISGDHEIIFPVENWYDLNGETKSLHLVVFPQMGHGPHHEAPETNADIIKTFLTTR